MRLLGRSSTPLDAAYLPHFTTPDELARAQQARQSAQVEFFRAVDENMVVRETAEKLRRRRIENGFGDLIEKSMLQPRKDRQ